jgi:uncharacterized repeat protein (TIGR04138 family)
MKKVGFNEALNQIQAEDLRYRPQAYHFIREALDFSIKHFAKPMEGPGRHVSGAELLEGIRRFALQEYGPMSKTVLNHWGVRNTGDFGHLVFNLVDKGVLGKTQEDRLEDFLDGYDFDDVFRKPFRPRAVDPATLASLPNPTE